MGRAPTLLDHRGRPVRTRELTREVAGPSTTGVRSVVPTTATSGMDAGRLASVLKQAETPGAGSAEAYLELAEHMEEVDLHYAGVLSTRKRQVAQIGVTVEPADDSADAAADADLVRGFLGRGSLADELQDVLDAVGKGFSVTEIDWETSERQWMPRGLRHRAPTWFHFDETTGETLLLKNDDGRGEELPPFKFVEHRSRAKSGLPIRGGLARIAAWSWLFKTMTLVDWVRFANSYGQPLRIGKFGPGAKREDIDTLERAVANISSDFAAIIPEGMLIEFVADLGARGRSDIYWRMLRYLDGAISVAVLGQTLTTDSGADGSGSYALGAVHDLVRHDIERSDAAQLAETLARDIAVPIVQLNRGPRAAYPTVRIERPPAFNAAEVADVIAKLVPLGLPVRVDDVLARLGYERPAPGDDVLSAATPPSPPPPPPRTRLAQFRDGVTPFDELRDPNVRHARAADPLAVIVESIDSGEWERLAAGIVEPVLAWAKADPEGLLTAIAKSMPTLDADALQERLARILFVADLWGRHEADQDPQGETP